MHGQKLEQTDARKIIIADYKPIYQGPQTSYSDSYV